MVERDCRGFSYVEVLTAFVVLTIVAGMAFTADTGQLRQVEDSFAETKAHRLVVARLETLRSDATLRLAGERPFEMSPQQTSGLAEFSGVENITKRRDGLFELVVEVAWLPRGAATRRRIRLVTWVMP